MYFLRLLQKLFTYIIKRYKIKSVCNFLSFYLQNQKNSTKPFLISSPPLKQKNYSSLIIEVGMQNQLNYYSRYNRIKVQQKKAIPSLYSLLSINTLNKLAFDATISLQMISLYKKEKLYRSSTGHGQGDESEYLQANNLITFRSFESQSVDRKSHFSQKGKDKINSSKNKTKISESFKQSKVLKQAYLENLVREVRQKSRQRYKQGERRIKDVKRKKSSKRIGKMQILDDKTFQFQVDQVFKNQMINNSKEKSNLKGNNVEAKPSETHLKIAKRKVIKSLLSQSQRNNIDTESKDLPHQKNIEEQQHHDEERKEYVESIDDGNQKEDRSGPSIVIQRLNFRVDQTHANLKDRIKERFKNQIHDSVSKEDNPSSKNVKQSQIKSFSKDLEKISKPNKNLIELQLVHSQSQIWKPEERSLQIPFRQINLKEQVNSEISKNRQVQKATEHVLIERSKQQKRIVENRIQEKEAISMLKKEGFQVNKSQSSKKDSFEGQIQDPVEKNMNPIMNQIFTSLHTIEQHVNIQFLSQINKQKQVEQPPDEHPLQLMAPSREQFEIKKSEEQVYYQTPLKKLYKNYIFNKELNPRLVTSTILNDKSAKNTQFLKEKIKNQIDQNQRQVQEVSRQKKEKGNDKMNFKKLIKKKKEESRQEEFQKQTEKHIPLRKLQNQKLLQAFFNNN